MTAGVDLTEFTKGISDLESGGWTDTACHEDNDVGGVHGTRNLLAYDENVKPQASTPKPREILTLPVTNARLLGADKYVGDRGVYVSTVYPQRRTADPSEVADQMARVEGQPGAVSKPATRASGAAPQSPESPKPTVESNPMVPKKSVLFSDSPVQVCRRRNTRCTLLQVAPYIRTRTQAILSKHSDLPVCIGVHVLWSQIASPMWS